MSIISVDTQKCVVCGMCVDVCPVMVLSLQKTGPVVKDGFENICIACGHCVAICPEAALDHTLSPLSEHGSIKHPVLDDERALGFLRKRRSIRIYQEKAVPEQILSQWLDGARFAQTAGNTQGISFLVVSDKSKLKKIADLTIEYMEAEIAKGTPRLAFYARIPQTYKMGHDIILRKAPHLVLAYTTKKNLLGRDNTCTQFVYAELYAPTLGIGTCWAGFVEMAARNGYQPMMDLLELPEDQMITGAMLAGYPKYEYHRLPPRRALSVKFI